MEQQEMVNMESILESMRKMNENVAGMEEKCESLCVKLDGSVEATNLKSVESISQSFYETCGKISWLKQIVNEVLEKTEGYTVEVCNQEEINEEQD